MARSRYAEFYRADS